MTVETEISAPPYRVWELITDISLMPRFSAELQSVEWTDGFDAPILGARFLGTNRHSAVGEWTTISSVTDLDLQRSFGWAVGNPENAAATWRFEIEPATGGSRLRYTARLGPGPSGVTMLIGRDPGHAEEIIEGRLDEFRRGMAATVAGIKALAEA